MHSDLHLDLDKDRLPEKLHGDFLHSCSFSMANLISERTVEVVFSLE